MSELWGNLDLYGILSVSQNTSGGYSFPTYAGENGEFLGVVNDGKVVFARPGPTMVVTELSGGQDLIDDVNFLLGQISGISGQIDTFEELLDTPSFGSADTSEGEIVIVNTNASSSSQKISYSGIKLSDLQNDIGLLQSETQYLSGAIDNNTNDISILYSQVSCLSGSTDQFIDLNDTPSSYTGQAGQVVLVNSSEDGLEFGSAGDPNLRAEVESLSGNLQTQIISNNNDISVLQSQTQYLSGAIDAIEEESTVVQGDGDRISAAEGPTNTWTISFDDTGLATDVTVASISGDLQNQINNNDTGISNLQSETQYLSGAIDSITVPTSADFADVFVNESGDTMTGRLTIDNGTVTSSDEQLNITGTWNNASETFNAFVIDITNSGSQSNSHFIRADIDGSTVWELDRGGDVLGRNNYEVQRTNATFSAYQASVEGEAEERFEVRADGRLTWGSGSAARDTNLYRDEANIIKTDDSLKVATDFYIESLTASLSGNFLTWEPNGKIVDSGFSNESFALSGHSLQDAYDNGNTIIHDNTNDIELFGNSGTGLSVDAVGDVTVDTDLTVGGEADILDVTPADTGQFDGAVSIQGGLRIGYGLNGGDTGEGVLYASQGDDISNKGLPGLSSAIFSRSFIATNSVDHVATLVGRIGSDSGAAIAPNERARLSGVYGVATYDDIGKEMFSRLAGGTFRSENSDGPTDNSAFGVIAEVDIGTGGFGFRNNYNGGVGIIAGVECDVDVVASGDNRPKTIYGVHADVQVSGDRVDVQYGGWFNSDTTADPATVNYGIYASATGADTNWAGYFDGDVAITSLTPSLSGNFLTWDGEGRLIDSGLPKASICVSNVHSYSPPSSNFATIDTRNNHKVLDFDDSTDESAIFDLTMPSDYSGGSIEVTPYFAMTSAISGDVVIETAFERIGDEFQDIDSDSFATGVSATISVPTTSGHVKSGTSISHTSSQIDGILAGDAFRLRIKRDADNGSDTAVGDMELLRIVVQEV